MVRENYDTVLDRLVEGVEKAIEDKDQNRQAEFVEHQEHNVLHRCDSSPFKRCFDPDGAQSWIEELERNFIMMAYPEADKVAFVTFMLVGEAEHWWKRTHQQLEAKRIPITWDIFRQEFLKEYSPKDLRKRKEICHFSTLENRCHVNEKDAKAKQAQWKSSGPQRNFQQRREQAYGRGKPYQPPQRQQGSSSGGSEYSAPTGSYSRSSGFSGKCFICEGPHIARDCPRKSFNCYKCGKQGHLIRDCPEWKSSGPQKDYPDRRNDMQERGKPYQIPPRPEGSSSLRGSRYQFSAGSSNRPGGFTGKCFVCGGPHLARECSMKNFTCFKCGKQGHYVRDCPEWKKRVNNSNNRASGSGGSRNRNQPGRSRTQGNVFAMSGEEKTQFDSTT